MGDYELKDNKTDDDIVWIATETPYYWTLKVYGFELGNKSLSVNTKLAVVDSGSEFTLIPSQDFDVTLKELRKKMNCVRTEAGIFLC